jgi:hypothetical protein
MQVGSIVKLGVPMLGNEAGVRGVAYEHYVLGDRDGLSFIFENGEYDGFSPDEQQSYLKEIGLDPEVANYQFRSVMYLSDDFRKGRFDEALRRKVGS